MFKRLLIAASFVAASLSFQTSAQANGGVVVKIGGGHGFHKGTRVHKKFHKPRRKIHRQRQVYKKPVHRAPVYKAPVYKAPVHKRFVYKAPKHYQGARHHTLSNKQLRHRLKAKGLYNIRFVDRYNGVAKVIAHNHRGYIAKYSVSTLHGHILSGRVIRYK